MIKTKELQKFKKQKDKKYQDYCSSEAMYWKCIIKNFPQYDNDKYHLECQESETFIVDESTGSEIYYLPNGFKL